MADNGVNQYRRMRPGQVPSHLAHGILALGLSLFVHASFLILGYCSIEAGFSDERPPRPQGLVPDASILQQAESSPLPGTGIGVGEASPKGPPAVRMADFAAFSSTPISTSIGRAGEGENPLRGNWHRSALAPVR